MSLSIVTQAGLSVWQTVIRLHAYTNGACSYTVLSYAVISKYVQYTSVRYIAPYYWQINKSNDNINFQSKCHHNQVLTINSYMRLYAYKELIINTAG